MSYKSYRWTSAAGAVCQDVGFVVLPFLLLLVLIECCTKLLLKRASVHLYFLEMCFLSLCPSKEC